ncbi:SpoIVB peptidase [Heliorestis acidaminivorans]|uniref:SpoIVB peptidase n=1 Tax=Heliorestis acidaminivorans TaxID=553427 RepID=A0A6I0EYB6_9FIRM|nr:SpoIVB peptidase [Heliorestis acidaminivorans]KAB2951692.1 SpoIVB peptidase [Heliorestis acidaminivorans]
MAKERIKQVTGILLALLLLTGSLTEEAQSIWSTPSKLRTTVGEEIPIDRMFPPSMLRHVTLEMNRVESPALQALTSWTDEGHGQDVKRVNVSNVTEVNASNATEEPGRINVTLRLLGLIPLKNIIVDVLPPMELLPGGHSIGVMLHSEGVIVVGQAPITDGKGDKYYPAKVAGLQVGDVIHRINQKAVKSEADLARIIDELGRAKEKIEVEWSRNGKMNKTEIEPIICGETKRYRIGLFVRDRASGVGTLTFLDPKSKTYGALGHVINDADTNKRINVADGKIIPASIKSIHPGRKGAPGEKVGLFQEDKADFSGDIKRNTYVGIFGQLEGKLTNPFYPEPIPIALSAQVMQGPAEIITVVNGDKLERFQIQIDRIMPHRSDGKGLVIRVTDPRLLNLTGGIIQGMSGSPIIQNGRIVGAVTHVFINSPSTGYGCLVEQMLEEAGLWKKEQKEVGTLQKEQSPFFELLNK